MKIWGITDVGLVRKENQDAYAVESRDGFDICAVCDGMGGAAAGKLASEIAVRTYMEALGETLTEGMDLDAVQSAMAAATSRANRAIREEAARKPEYAGMGTTLVSAVSGKDGIVVANVGDSRAYRVTAEGIQRITRDHSLVESMVERGDITEEEARRHPNRNLITRALGTDETVESDGYRTTLAAGEYLLLCTDGLTITVTDQEMLFEILHGGDEESCLSRLLAIAKEHGAPDNVTAVLMRQTEGGE